MPASNTAVLRRVTLCNGGDINGGSKGGDGSQQGRCASDKSTREKPVVENLGYVGFGWKQQSSFYTKKDLLLLTGTKINVNTMEKKTKKAFIFLFLKQNGSALCRNQRDQLVTEQLRVYIWRAGGSCAIVALREQIHPPYTFQ